MTDIIDVNHLKKLQQEFSKVREWDKFHSPKNLAMALTVESGELLEIFQWMTEEESQEAYHNPKLKEQTAEELADIMLYLIRLADRMQINLQQSIQSKLVTNNIKHPAKHINPNSKKQGYFTD